jgi:uncharacterized repeat protein (TIGR02543 family)
MSEVRSVTATFNPLGNQTLEVKKDNTGTGNGTVKSLPGIECGSNCDESYAFGTSVTLTAEADVDSIFISWNGACTGTGTTCAVTMNANKTVTAKFSAKRTLKVEKDGTGDGTVKSLPGIAGIDCGADCDEFYADGTPVTLTAEADANSTFMGWTGDCTGTGTTCAVTMNANQTVTAKFNKK